jgi:glycosyltransferase involved in cell wall biosynthesis
MSQPNVSFVVPCYNLGHVLRECVESILAQTYGDFEVLIMDDCSPDQTSEVASSFKDPRVNHVRNPVNLGALPNYNKGIAMSAGHYVWLISADDCLRRPDVLQRYVQLMDAHPSAGYVFCPAMGMRDGRETHVLDYSRYGERDRVIDGRRFLADLLNRNFIVAASAMARKACYEQISLFPMGLSWAGEPVDMIWGGDWYLWCMFALQWDVGYLAEPMVCYREHELSMTNTVTRERLRHCAASDIAVLWLVKERARALGLRSATRVCLKAAGREYARQRDSKEYQWLGRSVMHSMTAEEVQASLRLSTEEAWERRQVLSQMRASIGDFHYARGERGKAREQYLAALRADPLMLHAHAKTALLSMGKPGAYLRNALRSLAAR